METETSIAQLAGVANSPVPSQHRARKPRAAAAEIWCAEENAWKDKQGKEWLTKDESDAALLLIAEKVGGNEANNVTLKKKNPSWNKKHTLHSTKCRCPFFNRTDPQCPWCLNLQCHADVKMCRVVLCVVAHNDHNSNFCGKGCRPELLAKVNASALSKQPRLLVEEVTDDMNISLDEQKQLKAMFKKRKAFFVAGAKLGDIVNGLSKDSLGALHKLLHSLKRDTKLNNKKFNENETFLLGGDFTSGDDLDHVDKNGNQTFKFAAVLSTEEFLLNAVRQEMTGQPGTLFVDSSHRHTDAKNVACLTLKVVSPDQEGHVVAYAVVNSGNQSTHEFVFAVTKKEVEAAMRRRIEAALCEDLNELKL